MPDHTLTEKINVLLPHWLEHNQEHIAVMQTYLDALEQQGETETTRTFAQAIARMDDVSAALQTVIATLAIPATHR
ncbi:hypothetical protein ACL2XP_17145 [Sodalis sp. RH21]|uniref:hypothetical protein n=1 Tax=unclassified Sodalis (in: enterobacteria) TaxID=2636512 RepID=UPI0039B38B19